MAADVYAMAPHAGRGGWSWYTGSAGWRYRLMLESLLGLTRAGEHLQITPCMPLEWSDYSMRYRFGTTYYQINIARVPANNVKAVMYTLDGVPLDAAEDSVGVLLVDDQREHVLEVFLALTRTSKQAH